MARVCVCVPASVGEPVCIHPHAGWKRVSIHECVNMSVYMCTCVCMCENGVWEHVYVGMHFVSVYVRVWIYVYISVYV